MYDDGFQAVKELDLTFEEGKINVLIGPSGCGKTTTMRMINRLSEHTSGKLTISGTDIREIDPIELRRKTGYVIQSIGLFPHMTIYDNVAAVPKLLKWDKERINKRVDELLNMVHLDPIIYKYKYPSELSGGQQQRIGVIRALAAEPDTILMDEPFSALDPISRESLQEELIRINKEIHKTVIFVTHDMDEAIRIADEIILMKDGVIVQQGSPYELLSNPADEFVRKFIGEERILNGTQFTELDNYVNRIYPTVRDDMNVSNAIEKMTKNNILCMPVINKNDEYKGVLSLINALNSDGQLVKELIEASDIVHVHDDVAKVFEKLQHTDGALVPVITKEKQYVGVIEKQKILNEMNQNNVAKSGVV